MRSNVKVWEASLYDHIVGDNDWFDHEWHYDSDNELEYWDTWKAEYLSERADLDDNIFGANDYWSKCWS